MPRVMRRRDPADRLKIDQVPIYGGEPILITRRGKPTAKLVPMEAEEAQPLTKVQGWLDDDDPFFAAIDSIVEDRSRRTPRVFQELESP